MDRKAFCDAVEADVKTELTRLGSSKLLVGLTDARLEASAVAVAVARLEAAAAAAYENYAEAEGRGEDSNEGEPRDVGAFFVAAARDATDRYEMALGEVERDVVEPDEAVLDALQEAEDTAARLGGAVGFCLVTTRTYVQVVGFFLNEADAAGADRYRESRAGVEGDLERASSLVAGVEETKFDRARASAVRVVEAAYRSYADRLEAMGVDPRPVC